MKTSFKARYEPEKASAAATVAVKAGKYNLRASVTDATVVNGPSLNGLALALEKPGSFIVYCDFPKLDLRFQYMSTVKIADKTLNLTYIRSKGSKRTTIMDGTLIFDSANKISANHMLGTGNARFKYTYLHRGLTTFEPSYDLEKDAWGFAVSRKVYGDDVFKATYQTATTNLGLEWSRSSKWNGSFKVSASVNLAEEQKMPRLCAETTWEYEL